MVSFTIRLEQTYWAKGFFNVSVDFERFLTHFDGSFDLYLAGSDAPIVGRISRGANRNVTPRIYGNKLLATFFQERFKVGDPVQIDILTNTSIRIHASEGPQ